MHWRSSYKVDCQWIISSPDCPNKNGVSSANLQKRRVKYMVLRIIWLEITKSEINLYVIFAVGLLKKKK